MALRHTLLGLLDWIPLHGYALREKVRGYANIYPMTNASIYPMLRELESEGFVRHEEEICEGRLRKVYHITEAGRAELRRWLGDPTEQRGLYRDPVLLKVCLLRSGAFGDAAVWLGRELERCREAIDGTERLLKESGDRLPRYTRITTEHGLDLLRARAHWLARVLGELEAEVERDEGR
jgi:DNA-binding PadR family transcriptional regulator